MKKRFLNHLLSWTLTGTMILSASGFMPGMLKVAQADTTVTSAVNSGMSNVIFPSQIGAGYVYFGTKMNGEYNEMEWSVNGTSGGLLNLIETAPVVYGSAAESGWKDKLESYLTHTELDLAAADTTIAADPTKDVEIPGAADGTTLKLADTEVTKTKLYLLSNYEAGSVTTDDDYYNRSEYWTRNALSVKTLASGDSTAYQNCSATAVPGEINTNSYKDSADLLGYRAAVNLDISNRNTILLATTVSNPDEPVYSYSLVMVGADDEAIQQPTIIKAYYMKSETSVNGDVKITLNADLPAGCHLCYLETDKDYKDASADVIAYGTSGVIDKTATVPLQNKWDKLYIFCETDTATTRETRYTSTPLLVEWTRAPFTSTGISSMPTQLYYVKGSDFDPAGLKISYTLTDGTTGSLAYPSISCSSDEWRINPLLTGLTTGEHDYQISYYDSVGNYLLTAADTVKVTVLDAASHMTGISIPQEASVDIFGILALPTVTYAPADTTDDRTVVWTLLDGTGSAYFVNEENEKLDDSTGATAIQGEKSGTVSLKATVGGFSSTQTITVTTKNAYVEYYRLYGENRYETAAEIAEAAFPNGATSAILVRGDTFPDALAVNGLAGGYGGERIPVLLTESATIPAATDALLKQLHLSSLTIIGGTEAISTDIETKLKTDYGIDSVTRVAGADRYGTAEQIYERGRVAGSSDTSIWSDEVVIASGTTAADALSISPWCYNKCMPVLLTDQNGNLSASSLVIAQQFEKAYVLGGEAAVSAKTVIDLESVNGHIVTRIGGADRYETSVMIARFFGIGAGSDIFFNNTGFASGEDDHSADALVGGMLMGTENLNSETGYDNGAPIILVKGMTEPISDLLNDYYTESSSGVNSLYFLGGPAAVSNETLNSVIYHWSGMQKISE